MDKRKSLKKAKKNNCKKISIAGALVALFVLIVVLNVAFSHSSRLTTTIVRRGSEEEAFSAEGFVFRKQTLINAPQEGYIYCIADEDERVKSGEVVMHIYKNEINHLANNKIKEIDERITQLSGTEYSGDVFSNDPARIEQTIAQRLYSVPKMGFKGNIRAVSEIAEDVNSLIEKRRVISGELVTEDSSEEIKRLKDEKAKIESEYSIERTLVHSPVPGAFTTRVDGMEEALSLDKLEEIDFDYIKELDKMSTETQSKEKTKQGEAVGKIVDNFSWSVAAVVSAEAVEGVNVGDSLSLRLPEVGIETASCKVSKLVPASSNKVILVVSSNKYLDTVYSSSKVKVDFIKNTYDGFRIPAKSLRMTDGVMGVYVIRNDKARFVPVQLLYNGKDWVVVADAASQSDNGLKLYDELIISGENLYDNKVVR